MKYLSKQREEPKAQSALLYVVLGAFAGLRPVEIGELEWSSIDLKKKLIYVKSVRVKVARVVPIKPNLFEFLLPLKGSKGLVVPHKGTGAIVSRYSKEADVEYIPHGLRHSFATYRLAETHNLKQVTAELGTALPIRDPKSFKLPTVAVAKRYWSIRPSK